MNCKLTKEDCAEIYHALGYAHAGNLQARIGCDGEKLEKCAVNLFKRDALTIYRALMTKRERILEGAYDSYPGEVKQVGSITFELAEQFGRILAEIGNLGENLVTRTDLTKSA
jgi:hypothetical protein